MKKNEFRVVIKHFYIKSNTPKDTKADLDEVHVTSAPSFKSVYNCVNEFERVLTFIRDEPCSGPPVEAATPKRNCLSMKKLSAR